MLRYMIVTFVAAMVLTACDGPSRGSTTAVIPQTDPSPTPDPRPVILAFGDSLTAGHGVNLASSYPSQLQRELDKRGYNYRVINAGVSGDTTSGGLSRIDSALAIKPKIVILELGANDGLRGVPVRDMKHNLDEIISRCQAVGGQVILAGMTLPLNYGPDYIHDFESTYLDLANKHHTALIPFFLDGVAARMDLNQEDGIHPTAKGYVIVTATVMKYLAPLLGR